MNIIDLINNEDAEKITSKAILDIIINETERFVLVNRYRYLTPEHFLYCLTKNEITSKDLLDIGVDLQCLEEETIKYFNDFIPKSNSNNILKSEDWILVMEHAQKYANIFKNDNVTILHIILSIYDLEESYAKYFLLKQGLIRTHILALIENTGKYAVKNIEKLEKIIIMQRHLEPIISGLLKMDNGNVVLVGEKNSGKTGLILSLSNLIKNKKLGSILDDYCVVDLNAVDYLAQNELGKVVDELDELEKLHKPLCFVDITHVDLTKAEYILKKYFINDKIKVIFETSEENFLESENYKIIKNFVTVCEMQPFNYEETYEISKYAAQKYENHYNISIPEEKIIEIIKACDNKVNEVFKEFEQIGIKANNKIIN